MEVIDTNRNRWKFRAGNKQDLKPVQPIYISETLNFQVGNLRTVCYGFNQKDELSIAYLQVTPVEE